MLVDAELPIHLLNTVSEFFISIMQVVLIAVAALYVLALLPAIAIALFLIQHFYLRTSKQLRQLDLQSKSSLHTKFIEASTGLLTIRAHGWQGTMREEFGEKLDRSQEPLYLLAIVQLWLQLTLNLLVTGLSITVAGFAVGIRDKTNVGAIGVAFLNMTTLGERMTRFITSWTSLEVAIGAIARIQAFEKDTPEETDPESPVNVAAKWPESGTIRFDNVWASYDTFPDKTDWSLRGVSFQIRSGEKIAICGRTGSGKSTLLVSLLALIEAKEGAIAVDDVDISRVERSILRSRFDVISQDTFSQGETVRGALDPEGRFSDEAITEILEDCAMLHKIESSGGFSTKVVEISFSAGEAQLFALARTILGAQYRQSGIVLLDEATSRYEIVSFARNIEANSIYPVIALIQSLRRKS